jgi:hypothetical protein
MRKDGQAVRNAPLGDAERTSVGSLYLMLDRASVHGFGRQVYLLDNAILERTLLNRSTELRFATVKRRP